MNHTIQTYTGVTWDLLNPRVEDVNIEDIAHSLSLQCRFTGHSRVHYSVAQQLYRKLRAEVDTKTTSSKMVSG
ncbi:MAG: hypothetical protein ACTSX8_04570 [Alphaproteobacteria bacterium]